ncbi:MAG: BNR-4 repeat-containing protein [Clostridia bacterium]|nr:BNR-4 repeat-containing protein [Clostridia bacterium]
MREKLLSAIMAALMLASFLPCGVFAAETVWSAADVKSFGANDEILPSASEPNRVLVAANQAGWSGATTFTDTDGTVTAVPSLSGSPFANARNTVVAFSVPEGTVSTDLAAAELAVTVSSVKQVTSGNRLAVYGHSLSTPWAGTTITKETFGASSAVSILSEEEMPLLGLTDAITAGSQTSEAVSGQTVTVSTKTLTAYVKSQIDAGAQEITFQFATTLGGTYLYSAASEYVPSLTLTYASEANASLNYVCGGVSIGTKALSSVYLNEAYTLTASDAPLNYSAQGKYYYRQNGGDIVITPTQKNQVFDVEYTQYTIPESYTVTQEGAACWFGDPRSLRYENTEMGIDATYIGYIDVHGAIKATQYDHTTDTVSEVLIRSNFQPDDHNSPTWLALPDGRIMVFYSRHTDEARFFYRVSAKAGDITTLGEEKILAMANNTTYPNPYILSSDPNHIYLCWRGINWHPTIGRLTMPDANGDCTFDWGPKQIVSSTIQGSGCRPYAKYTSDGESKIYMTYSATHPDNVNPTCIYFSYIDITDLTVRDINGAVKASLDSAPFTVTGYETDTAYVVDDSTTSQRGWVWDIALDGTKPVIAMVRISSDKQQHDYYCATYNEGVWTKTHLADAGKYFHQTRGVEQCYSGGMSINHANPREIYGSEPVDGIYGEVYEIAKYTLSEDYSAVETTEYITQNSQKNNVRPVYTINARQDGEMALTWMRGDYYYWIVNSTYPLGFPTSIMTSTPLPAIEASDFESVRVFSDSNSYAPTDAVQLLGTAMQDGSFTAVFTVKIDETYASGTIFSAGDFTLGVERTTADNTGDTFGYGDLATVIPYVEIGTERYYSVNRLSDSDWMQSYGSTTSGAKGTDNMGEILYALTYDAQTGECETYVNSLLDQHIEAEAALSAAGEISLGAFAGTVSDVSLYSKVLSQGEIRVIGEQALCNALVLPEYTVKNLALPSAAEDGTAISWTTSDADVITESGIINRQWNTRYATLSAHMTFPALGSVTKDFKVAVLAKRTAADSMYLHYEFEDADVYEKDGNTYVADKTGLGNDALLCGSAVISNGALDLTANTTTGFSTNGYLNVTTPILEGLRSYSVVTKVNLASTANMPRIYDFGSNAQHSVFCRASALGAGIKNSNTLIENANTQLTAGTDTYVTVTYDTDTKITSIYLNETLVGSGSTITHEPYQIGTSARNYIGRTQWWDSNSDNSDMIGTIDDFRIYSCALSPEGIALIVNGADEGAHNLPPQPTAPTIAPAFNGVNNVSVVKDADTYCVFMRADTGYDYLTQDFGFVIKKETGAPEQTYSGLIPNEQGVVGIVLSEFVRPRKVAGYVTYLVNETPQTVYSDEVIIDPSQEYPVTDSY